MTPQERPERPNLPPPPDELVAATAWSRWWWIVAASLGVLTWTVASLDGGPTTWRARAIVDARTVAAIEFQLHSRGLLPSGTGGT